MTENSTGNDGKTPSIVGMVFRHRRAAVLGGAAGASLLIGWLAYEWVMTPSRPMIQTASAGEVVRYISDARGLARLPQVEQQRFLDQWRDHLLGQNVAGELTNCFSGLSDKERRQFTDAMARQIKRKFIDDAEEYARIIDAQGRSRFLRDRLSGYEKDFRLFKDVARALKPTGPARQEDMQQWIMENTTAEERVVGEPYFEAMKRVREQIKKEQRGPAEAAAQSAPVGGA